MSSQASTEEEDIWRAVGPALEHPDRVARARTEMDAMLSWLKLPPAATVLDLCCGPGVHAVELAARGCVVTGVDGSAPLLERARERAREAGAPVDLVLADARQFRRPESFDLVVNLGTSLGLTDRRDDVAVLRNACASARPGGRVLVEILGREVLARQFRERWWIELGESLMLEERTLADDAWQTMSTRLIVVREGRRREYHTRMQLYAGAELRQAFEDAGLADVQLFGDLDGKPYDQHAVRLVVLGRRPPLGER